VQPCMTSLLLLLLLSTDMKQPWLGSAEHRQGSQDKLGCAV
jgi:hypothetical protein